MANRIYKALKANGIDTTLETIETIINGNGTKADGDIYDIIETLAAVKVDDIGNGYPLKSGTYPTIDKATARYKALIRMAKKGAF